MSTDYGKELAAEFESIRSIEDVCKNWAKIKPVLIAAQSILRVFFPAAADVIGRIISVLDGFCHGAPGARGKAPRSADDLKKAHGEIIAAWKPTLGVGGGRRATAVAKSDTKTTWLLAATTSTALMRPSVGTLSAH
jgi:hypothetical protein